MSLPSFILALNNEVEIHNISKFEESSQVNVTVITKPEIYFYLNRFGR